jgi:hypothetical protein
MFKKLIIFFMALVASTAFGLPSTASATNDPQLTEGGVKVASGAAFVGTTIGETIVTNANAAVLARCTTGVMSGTVLTNAGSPGPIEAEISSVALQGSGSIHAHNGLPECTTSFGNAYLTVSTPLCIRSTPAMATDEFQLSGGKCSAPGKVEFTVGSTTAGACTYESWIGAFKGSYTTGGAEAKMTIAASQEQSGSALVSGSFLCPGSTVRMGITFNLETANGTKFTIS